MVKPNSQKENLLYIYFSKAEQGLNSKDQIFIFNPEFISLHNITITHCSN